MEIFAMRLFTIIFTLIFTSLNLINAETTTVKVATGKTYSNLAWYDLNDDATSSQPLIAWDFAILCPGQNAAVIINSGVGCKLWEVVGKTVDDFGNSIDTVGMTTKTDQFKEWFNSDVTWSIGAFNCGSDGFEGSGDFGWGTYNINTHTITGSKLFIMKSAAGKFYQIRIEDLLSGVFYFGYANLDGTGKLTKEISKKSFPGKTFGYFSFTTNDKVDLDADSWSLLFGKYITQVDNGQGGTSPYNVNGIRHNYGWSAVKIAGQNPANVTVPGGEQFSGKITTIGHEWKKLNSSMAWEIPTDLCYFVLSEDGLGWKIVFKAFAGSTTGEVTFEKTPVKVVSVEDNSGNKAGFFSISPNVIESDGSFDLAYGSLNGTLPTEITIYDLNGNKVFAQNLDASALSAVTVSPRLSTGMYLISMNIGGNNSVQKLIVK
jgi:hypothetical protein